MADGSEAYATAPPVFGGRGDFRAAGMNTALPGVSGPLPSLTTSHSTPAILPVPTRPVRVRDMPATSVEADGALLPFASMAVSIPWKGRPAAARPRAEYITGYTSTGAAVMMRE